MWSAGGLRAASTGELVEGVCAALGELAVRQAPESAAGCLELAGRLGRGLDLGETALAGLLGVADRAGQASVEQYAGTKGWLLVVLGMRGGRAEERLTVTRQLGRLPTTARLLREQKLSFGYASTIAEAVARLDDEDCVKAEEILLALAEQGVPATAVARHGLRIRELIAERDGTERPPEDARRGDRSWLTLAKSLNGSSLVKGVFDPALTALLRDRLGPLSKPAGPEDTRDHGQRMADALEMVLSGGKSHWNATLVIKLTHHTTTTGTGTARDAESEPGQQQRPQHDPADDHTGETQRRQPSTGDDGTGEVQHPHRDAADERTGEQQRPHRDAEGHSGEERHCRTEDDLSEQQSPCRDAESDLSEQQRPRRDSQGDTREQEQPRRDTGTGTGTVPYPRWPLEGAGGGWRVSARLPDGTPIPPELARTIALNAGVSALILGPDGIPLYLGDTVRFVTPGQRRALEALYDTCAFRECAIPARYCEVDHVLNWSDVHTTDIDLLAPCCSWHNRTKYRLADQVTMTRDAQGRWVYTIDRSRRRRTGATTTARGP